MQRLSSDAKSKRLTEDLAGLPHLESWNLRKHFRFFYGVDPPAKMRRSLLLRAIAYQLQEKALGGLRPSARRRLETTGNDASSHHPFSAAYKRKFKAGTTLIREWNGIRHRVTVLEDGVLFAGKRFRSLSEVARKITGTRWSGPLFFGLNTDGKEPRNGTD